MHACFGYTVCGDRGLFIFAHSSATVVDPFPLEDLLME